VAGRDSERTNESCNLSTFTVKTPKKLVSLESDNHNFEKEIKRPIKSMFIHIQQLKTYQKKGQWQLVPLAGTFNLKFQNCGVGSRVAVMVDILVPVVVSMMAVSVLEIRKMLDERTHEQSCTSHACVRGDMRGWGGKNIPKQKGHFNVPGLRCPSTAMESVCKLVAWVNYSFDNPPYTVMSQRKINLIQKKRQCGTLPESPDHAACHAMHASQVACHAMHASARHCTSKSGGPKPTTHKIYRGLPESDRC